ncbi:putative alkaline shock family protein YloU [Breznakia sp. PF5-3]|uniref:Asp23/Gls24 family envelope stress response protein n=1 Tax=unclassified Breznakia TaxID=2623764 RepID=UPI002407061D|nr:MULTISPECIES: Asp23/Gls24 family envelope stress response protein [unclassified Breznakia]MDL2276453.1 Asp23/Gls24 family envelope stress response protein [Breznakia sp. OttesenSCG-928-G09]MDF9825021.1 putative alkaline shock family protein YloU [Breznakia sp. PM6-1]MDF9835408.1 putative alkaline shock family protein YloU [Breznakia sp. PF5-3]MDF9837640.1 putative alkaline shock family protein YloU [Breznakia sp. PFB2-8]MDF9859504.1 putative alkaline shock family protein YloU [Breznakia sp.
MSITKNTKYGDINISKEAITTLAGGIVSESYGVVGMASQKFLKDGWAELLRKENFSKGVVVKEKDGALELDLYIIVSHGVKISEVVLEVQKKVKYMMEKTLDVDFETVNVFVQGIKVIK